MKKLKVLILDGDSRQSLPFMRSLKKASHNISVVCPWRCCPSYFSRYADKRLIWPNIADEEKSFYQTLLNYLQKGNADVILPLGDATAHLVSCHKEELTQYAVTPVPDYKVFMKAADKGQTMEYCMENNIPCPKTYNAQKQSLEEIINEVPFPVMVKPTRSTGAVGIHRFDTPSQLRRYYPILGEKYGSLIIQEFIPKNATQFHAEVFCDADSRMNVCMVLSKPRFFPVTGGTATCNVTIDRPDIVEAVRKLLEGIKWTGAADIDLLLDPRDDTLKILEINPRVPVSIKIGFMAGIDYADLQLKLAFGQEIPLIKDYKQGVILRNLCMDILWYINSSRSERKATKPPFWKFIGKHIYYQTFGVDDPFPLVGFVLSNLKKFRKPGSWDSKLGTDLKN